MSNLILLAAGWAAVLVGYDMTSTATADAAHVITFSVAVGLVVLLLIFRFIRGDDEW